MAKRKSVKAPKVVEEEAPAVVEAPPEAPKVNTAAQDEKLISACHLASGELFAKLEGCVTSRAAKRVKRLARRLAKAQA